MLVIYGHKYKGQMGLVHLENRRELQSGFLPYSLLLLFCSIQGILPFLIISSPARSQVLSVYNGKHSHTLLSTLSHNDLHQCVVVTTTKFSIHVLEGEAIKYRCMGKEGKVV